MIKSRWQWFRARDLPWGTIGELLGFVAIVAGIALIYLPAAFVVAGIMAVFLAQGFGGKHEPD